MVASPHTRSLPRKPQPPAGVPLLSRGIFSSLDWAEMVVANIDLARDLRRGEAQLNRWLERNGY